MTPIQLAALIVAAFVILVQMAALFWLLDRLAQLRDALKVAEATRAEIAGRCAHWRHLAGARAPEDEKP